MTHRFFAFVACVLIAAGCRPVEQKLTRASYDASSARLILLSADQNGDGAIDQWTYLDGNRPLRGEGDTDADGRIDRWEYFDADAQLTQVGTSSANDGIEDTWTWVTPIGGEARIDRSRRRDRQIDRHEFYKGDTLVRVEEDSNADGRVDKWERYEEGRLIEASFDTTLSRGRADRRLIYGANGMVVSIATDPEGDGTFLPLEKARDKGDER